MAPGPRKKKPPLSAGALPNNSLYSETPSIPACQTPGADGAGGAGGADGAGGEGGERGVLGESGAFGDAKLVSIGKQCLRKKVCLPGPTSVLPKQRVAGSIPVSRSRYDFGAPLLGMKRLPQDRSIQLFDSIPRDRSPLDLLRLAIRERSIALPIVSKRKPGRRAVLRSMRS